MNKVDLKSYKGNECEIKAMIPGIHNIYSVGSGPLKRSNRKINGD